MGFNLVRWFAIVTALIALNGCGSSVFRSNSQLNGDGPHTTNKTVNGGATKGSMKLISGVPVYGGSTFDPQRKLTDTSSIIGISEYQGYVAIVWWPNAGNLYMSVAKNGKWISTDEPMPLPWSQLNDYYGIIFSGNRLYYTGMGIAYSTVEFRTGLVSPITRLSVPREPYHSFYLDRSSAGPVLGYMAPGSTSKINIVRLYDGKPIVFHDKYHSLRAGIRTKYFVDYIHHRLITQGYAGKTRSIDYLTGEIARNSQGKLSSPAVDGIVIEHDGNLYSVEYPKNKDTTYQLHKFTDLLVPEGTITLRLQPAYNASRDQTWVTSSGEYIHIWHVFETGHGVELQQIAISQ